MKTHPVIDVAQLLRNRGHSSENQFDESEKSTPINNKQHALGGTQLGYYDSAGQGIEPSPLSRVTVRDFLLTH